MSNNNINNMDVKQLRNEVQLLRDELAIMQRKYEDILYNLDTDNFSSRFTKEQGNMRTAIEQNAKEIKLSASELDKEISSLSVTTKGIRSQVNKVENGEFNGYTLFEQTGSKFSFTGNVEISGNAIVGGTITGASLQDSGGSIELFLSDPSHTYGDMTLVKYNSNGSADELFSLYDGVDHVALSLSGTSVLHCGTDDVTYPKGTWNFNECDVEGLGGGYATFG